MIEKRGRCRNLRHALTVLQRERQCHRHSGGRQQRSEIQAVAAELMACLDLLKRGSRGRGQSVGVGMRYRTQLGNE